MSNFLGYLSMSPALDPGFSDLWGSPPALSSTPAAFGCLHFLVVQASRFTIHPLFLTQSVRPPLVTYPSLCSIYVTYRTPCYVSGHQVLPTKPCYHKCYGFERASFTLRCFLPYTPSCCPQGLLGAGTSPSKAAGLHPDHWNIIPAWLLLRMTTIQKRGIVVGSVLFMCLRPLSK